MATFVGALAIALVEVALLEDLAVVVLIRITVGNHLCGVLRSCANNGACKDAGKRGNNRLTIFNTECEEVDISDIITYI